MANENGKESLADYDQRKFGMFIHWGIYSVAGGEYQGKKIRGISEWIQHRLQIPVNVHGQLRGLWRAVMMRMIGRSWHKMRV